MLFADEIFWKPPNVYDTVGVGGLVLAVVSIWFSWWLAKRDIEKRLSQTRKELLLEVQRRWAMDQLADARHSAELAREAISGRSWKRSGVYCDMGLRCVNGLISSGGLTTEAVLVLRKLSDNLDRVEKGLRPLTEKKGTLPDDVMHSLNVVIRELREVEGRFRSPTKGVP
jgi:hypothetical protein